jgi:Yip1 domain
VIAGEFTKVPAIFLSYVILLSAIPPVAYLLGAVFFGEQGTLFGTFETTMGTAVQDAVVRYLVGLASVFLLGVALDLLAPVFTGQSNRVQAMKVAAYASTPAWLFGALAIVPKLGRYSVVGTLWMLYLVFLGAPPLMKVPADRAERIAGFGLVAAAAAAFIALLMEGIRQLTMG